VAKVYIPAQLRAFTEGAEWVEASGDTVGAVIGNLGPSVRNRLLRDGRLAPGLAIAVDGEITPLGLRETVAPETEIHFLTAISGGFL